MDKWPHIPVMNKEVIGYLGLKPGMVILDATIGTGGHAYEILSKIAPGGRLIGIDRDRESLLIAEQRLENFKNNLNLVCQDFRNIKAILDSLGVKYLDGILFDLGISSYQLDAPERGFSIKKEGPLDMRMDRDSYISAYDLINKLSSKEISSILLNFGQERWHRRIADCIVRERSHLPIATTAQLSSIVIGAVPHYAKHQKIHPATRTFQALRIAVNRELEALQAGLDKAVEYLKTQGRICVISFHSLEDRIVKNTFRDFYRKNILEIITRKPLRPAEEEVISNARSRSARLRVAQKI